MDHAGADGGRGQRHRLGAIGMDGVEALPAALKQMPTRLITTSASRAAASTESGIAQIGLHGVDLADPAKRLQMPGQLGPAHRYADAVAALGQRAHHMAAEKA